MHIQQLCQLHRIRGKFGTHSVRPLSKLASNYSARSFRRPDQNSPGEDSTSLQEIMSSSIKEPNQDAPTKELQSVVNSLQQVSIINKAISPPVHALTGASLAAQKVARRATARENRDAKTTPSEASGGIPNPTAAYMAASSAIPQRLREPQHLLVVIDLNGTLLFRPLRSQPTKFTARPHTLRFLTYAIDTFTVVIWSSARPENVERMCNAILTPQLRSRVSAIWGRDKFDLSPKDYMLRVQCYKRLTKLWADQQIARSHPGYASGERWNQTNTVLIDDSSEKGRSELYNLIKIPEFLGDAHEPGDILPQVHDYLNHLSMHSNVSACLRTRPFTTR